MEDSDLLPDSGIESDYTSDYESVNNVNYRFRAYNGRKSTANLLIECFNASRYHGISNNPYIYPCDDGEVIRLKKLHCVARTVYGGNVVAPINAKPTLILDIGTGSGDWAIEVADTYPSARVIGLDIAPVQPVSVPLNCEFLAGELRVELEDYDEGSVDLVHSRFIHAGIRKDEWSKLVNDMFRIIQPGNGWAQCTESGMPRFYGDAIPTDTVLPQFFRYFEQLFHSKNLVTSGASHLEPLFRDAGFIDVQVIRRTVDVGDWRGDPKTRALGCAAAAAFGDVWPTLADEFRTFIPDDEERKSFGERAAEEFKSGKYRCYFQMEMVIGRKPPIQAEQEAHS